MMIALAAYKLTQMFPKISERAAVFGLWIATFLLIGAALVGLYLWAYDNGRDSERARWEAKVAEIRKERDEAMSELAKADAAAAKALEATITDNRKALDDETANLPDQPLSDRQRARACRELVRQGRRCEPSAAAPGKAGD